MSWRGAAPATWLRVCLCAWSGKEWQVGVGVGVNKSLK